MRIINIRLNIFSLFYKFIKTTMDIYTELKSKNSVKNRITYFSINLLIFSLN